MLVNIKGRGYVPGADKKILMPKSGILKGYEATEAFVRHMIHFREWRVYDAATDLLITEGNIGRFFPNGEGGGSVTWEVLGDTASDTDTAVEDVESVGAEPVSEQRHYSDDEPDQYGMYGIHDYGIGDNPGEEGNVPEEFLKEFLKERGEVE